MTKMIAAPSPTTHASAAPLSSVAPTTTSNTPESRNRGHQRVRRVRAKRAVLRRAGLPAGVAGNPSAPGTGGTAGAVGIPGRSLSRRRDRNTLGLAARDLRPMGHLASGVGSASFAAAAAGLRPGVGRRAGDRAGSERSHAGPGSTSTSVRGQLPVCDIEPLHASTSDTPGACSRVVEAV
jgi:hypothetical protein